MKIIISGGRGLVGRFITRAALDAGHEVTLLGRSPEPGLTFQKSSLGAPADFSGQDAFIHCAFDHIPGKYRGGEGDDLEGFRQRNEGGSIRWFMNAKAAGVRRAVFLSSRAVYGGYPPGTTLTETMEPRPDTAYGEAKWLVEMALRDMADAVFTPVSLRATGVYGPGKDHKWEGLFADYLAGREIAPRVATEVHGADLAAAALLCLTGTPPHVLNVSDLTLDRHDLLGLVKEETGATHPLPERADATKVSAMDCTRLKALGWIPGGTERLRRDIPALLKTA